MNINFKFVAPMAVSSLLLAQVPQDPGSKAIPLSKVERKNKAPVSSEILRVKLPKPVEMTLPNGLTNHPADFPYRSERKYQPTI